MKQAQSYKVLIFNTEYSLISDETKEHVQQAAHKVDLLMKTMANQMNAANQAKIAVFVALQLASELLHATQHNVQLTENQKTLLDKIELALVQL